MTKRCILVTGGSRGLGRHTCERILDNGWDVIAISRTKVKLERYQTLKCDIASEDDVIGLFKKLEKVKIDSVINCAGITKTFENSKNRDPFLDIINVNLLGTYLISKYALPKLCKSKNQPSIVNVASIGGLFGFADNPGYGASKAGIINLTKSMAYDYSKYGIRVNCISPGYFKSDMTLNSFIDKKKQTIRNKNTLLNRFADLDEITSAILFLMSSSSSYINGENLIVDGGFSAKGLVE